MEPLVKVEIALYPEIHQVPSLNTLIPVVFPALAINYANQRYMDNRTILTIKNTVVNSLNTQIAEVVLEREHVFLSADSVETGMTKLWRLARNFSIPLLWQVCHHIA